MSGASVLMKPMRVQGVFVGMEARDGTSGALLARAEQTDYEGHLLVVVETHYSSAGAVIYKGKLFFEDDELVKQERLEGKKTREIFYEWRRGAF